MICLSRNIFKDCWNEEKKPKESNKLLEKLQHHANHENFPGKFVPESKYDFGLQKSKGKRSPYIYAISPGISLLLDWIHVLSSNVQFI